jgi:hypothetical protein
MIEIIDEVALLDRQKVVDVIIDIQDREVMVVMMMMVIVVVTHAVMSVEAMVTEGFVRLIVEVDVQTPRSIAVVIVLVPIAEIVKERISRKYMIERVVLKNYNVAQSNSI